MRITIFFMLLSYYLIAQNSPINVGDLNFRMMAMTEETMAVGFAEGDRIIINYGEERDKKLKSFELFSTEGALLHSEFNLTSLKNKELTIKNTGIYVFKFINSSLARRIISFKVDRIPASEKTVAFNTDVKQRLITDTTYTTRTETYLKNESFEVVEVASQQEFFINSGSNATFKGGKSRVTMPIVLPENTVKWYYQISSFRDAAMKEGVTQQMSLVSDLSKLVDKTGTLGFALDLVSEPPGVDYCDVYLIDHNNYSLFLNKSQFNHFPVGTRENIKSANVEVSSAFSTPIYLGIKNPDSMHGINVIVKIAAIVHHKELATREIEEPVITSKTEYYLENNY